MRVDSADNRTQFTGYVDKSVVRFVNKRVKARCDDIVGNAVRYGNMPDAKEIDAVKSLGARVITRLQQFMGDTHKNTSISIKQRCIKHDVGIYQELKDVYDLVITNPIAKKTEVLIASTREDRGTIPNLHYNLNIFALENLENTIIPELEKRGHQSIDSKFANAYIKKMTEVINNKPLFWKSGLKRMYKQMNDYFKGLSGVVDEELGKRVKNVANVVTQLTGGIKE